MVRRARLKRKAGRKKSTRLLKMKWEDLLTAPRYKNDTRWIGIVTMKPSEFLNKVPKIGTGKVDTKFYEKKLMKGEEITPPQIILSSSRYNYGWSSHEGRHRATLAKKLGNEPMPVAVYSWEFHREDEEVPRILEDLRWSRQGDTFIGLPEELDKHIKKLMKETEKFLKKRK